MNPYTYQNQLGLIKAFSINKVKRTLFYLQILFKTNKQTKMFKNSILSF